MWEGSGVKQAIGYLILFCITDWPVASFNYASTNNRENLSTVYARALGLLTSEPRWHVQMRLEPMRGQDSVGCGVYVRSTPNEPFARHAAPRFQNLYIKPAKLSQVFPKLEKLLLFNPNHAAHTVWTAPRARRLFAQSLAMFLVFYNGVGQVYYSRYISSYMELLC